MKNQIRAAVIFLIVLAALSVSAQQKSGGVTAVGNVDLKQYSGKWFEIARTPNKPEKECSGNVTATYTLRDDGLELVNQCLDKGGKTKTIETHAKNLDTSANTKFNSSNFGGYWIIDLDKNYKYAVVGQPDHKYLWILSRSPKMDDATYQAILRRVEKMGFDPTKLSKTPQNVETVKGTALPKQ
jgi:apolipoprotein D and lipocalin family protein